MNEENRMKRRDFVRTGIRTGIGLALIGIAGISIADRTDKNWVWQIDPFKCTQCGRCADHCIKKPSAVKCVHAFDLCGYCDLCGGYLKPESKERNTAAENQLCPTAAIQRKYIEDPYFEYVIDEELCIGCAKCVKGCSSFGNGSLHLQIRHDLCADCNECSIWRICPSDAILRVPSENPYLIKGDFSKDV